MKKIKTNKSTSQSNLKIQESALSINNKQQTTNKQFASIGSKHNAHTLYYA